MNLWPVCHVTLPGTVGFCQRGWRRRFRLWPSACWCRSLLHPAGNTQKKELFRLPSTTFSSSGESVLRHIEFYLTQEAKRQPVITISCFWLFANCYQTPYSVFLIRTSLPYETSWGHMCLLCVCVVHVTKNWRDVTASEGKLFTHQVD